MTIQRKYILLTFLGIALIFFGCRKRTVITSPSAALEFSTDTLQFDTVFTSVGSATKLFKIFNPHKQIIRITNITLSGGDQSLFRMNIDGISGTTFQNLEIAAEDSMYVFVEVTVDPTLVNTPFIVNDSVLFATNGNFQKVILEAHGQNANFFRDTILTSQIWNDPKPYVLRDIVFVDTGQTLRISAGSRIHLHAGALLIVAGKLLVEGDVNNPVTFEGDRLESFFDDLPGQWGSIVILRGSTGNIIRGAVISEATSAIIIGSSFNADLNQFTTANKPDVFIDQTIIKNCQAEGVFSFFSNVNCDNTLIHSCGSNNLSLLYGGNHLIRNSTIVNYGAIGVDHKSPVLRLSNGAEQNSTLFISPLSANFQNSIFWGSLVLGEEDTDGEILFEDAQPGFQPFDYLFENCLVKTNLNTDTVSYSNILKNVDPLFTELEEFDYSIQFNSPCKDAGMDIGLSFDITNSSRDALPDIGAYEVK